jgi:phosphatidylserine decarboxylase
MSKVDEPLSALQFLVPQHLVSRLARYLTYSDNELLKNLMIRWFVAYFNVDLSDALQRSPRQFATFNDFFTRAIEPAARPIAAADAVCSPVDGEISQAGRIDRVSILQVKDKHFSVADLLACDAHQAKAFFDGSFATIYLAPRNYHRIHMPITGTITQAIYVPGSLFSVDQRTTRAIDRLFARNERIIVSLDTVLGTVAVVLVGAMLVGNMELVCSDVRAQISATLTRAPLTLELHDTQQPLDRGAELGRFNMGSTVIVLFPRGSVEWAETIGPGAPVKMGERIATLSQAPSRRRGW